MLNPGVELAADTAAAKNLELASVLVFTLVKERNNHHPALCECGSTGGRFERTGCVCHNPLEPHSFRGRLHRQ